MTSNETRNRRTSRRAVRPLSTAELRLVAGGQEMEHGRRPIR
jgi:hypothetical protein